MEPDVTVSPIVIKIGGALLDAPSSLRALRLSIAAAARTSPVIVVHGGGPQSTALAHRLGHEPQLINGRRVTTDEDLRIALWTMKGELNARLVAALNAGGVVACGVSGIDMNLVNAVRRPPWTIDGERIDFGHVGDILSINPDILRILVDQGIVPVVAPLASDEAGAIYNINADTVASDIAIAMKAGRLVYVADSGGLWRDPADPSTRMAIVSHAEFEDGVREGWIDRGMRVKLENAFRALKSGVDAVSISAAANILDPNAGTGVRLPSQVVE